MQGLGKAEAALWRQSLEHVKMSDLGMVDYCRIVFHCLLCRLTVVSLRSNYVNPSCVPLQQRSVVQCTDWQ